MQWEPLIHVPIFRLILGIPFFAICTLETSWVMDFKEVSENLNENVLVETIHNY